MTHEELSAMFGGPADKPMTPDPRFSERQDGATPNGGAYSIAYYHDKQGNPCQKKKAVTVNIVEYDSDGNRINETYGRLGK